MRTYSRKILNFLKSKWGIGTIVLLVLILGMYLIFSRKAPKYQFATVQTGSITESVSLTGNTTPEQSVSLAFGSSGIVAQTYSDLGKQVSAGQVLAELTMTDLLAQLHNAQAGLTIAQQNALTSKNNVANVTAQQDALVASAQQTVYSNLAATPYDQFNTNTPPTISGSYNSTTEGSYVIKVYASGGITGASLTYSGLESGSAPLTVNSTVPLGTHGLFISFPAVDTNSYVNSTWTVNIPNTRWNGYASALKAYQTALENRDTAIANAEASVVSSDTNSISDAEIKQAEASVESVNAKIQNAKIVAPISGTVTQFDAKVGELATPSVPLISIMSDGGYEVDAGASETDIGKINIGDTVSMTLDAFQGETFTGKVFYIAPSETNVQGVISYQTKISFDKIDPRLKSGLTANITIETKHKDGVLILPQYAILQNDQGTYVETLENNKVVQHPVTLGISDQTGNVEVLSGATEGEEVINIGLKAQ